jgi:hypothetical protein
MAEVVKIAEAGVKVVVALTPPVEGGRVSQRFYIFIYLLFFLLAEQLFAGALTNVRRNA